MKVIKYLLILVFSLLLLLILAITYITLVIDPNDYKQDIIKEVDNNTGRQLVMQGNISWRFFPSLGLSIGKTQLNNPEGFPDQPMLALDSVEVDVALVPLLSKKVEIGQVSVKGLSVYLLTRKDGVSNLDDLTKKEMTPAPQTSADNQNENAPPKLKDIRIKGIQLVDAKITVEDLKAGTKQVIDHINFNLAEFSLQQWVELSFSMQLETGPQKVSLNSQGQVNIADSMQRYDLKDLSTQITVEGEGIPNGRLDVSNQLSGYFDGTNKKAELSTLSLSLLDININGKLTALLNTIPKINFDLKVSPVDLDKFLPPADKKEVAQQTEQPTNPDLSWMKQFDVEGKLFIESLKADKLSVSAIEIPLQIKAGKLKMTEMKANLYQGSLNTSLILDGTNKVPPFNIKATLSKVQALPLIKDLMDKEIVSGTLDLNMDISGKGLIDKQIRQGAKGGGNVAFTDGAVYGVNIAQMIRSAYAKIKGQTIEEDKSPPKTDFAALTASFTIENGIVNNPDLKLLSPLLRIDGKGQAQLIEETVDYALSTAIVGTLQGQGGKDSEELKKLTIPVKINGPMADPAFSLDMKSLISDEAKAKVDEKKEELKKKAKDKLKDKLKDFFN